MKFKLTLIFLLALMAHQAQGSIITDVLGVPDSTKVQLNKYEAFGHVLTVVGNQSYNFDLSDGKQNLMLVPTRSPEVGVSLGWKFIVLNITHSLRSDKNSHFGFGFYGNRIGLRVYQRKISETKITSMSGFSQHSAETADFDWSDVDAEGGTPVNLKGNKFNGLTTRERGINIYYVFNHRNFSFPAAYDKTTQQTVSSGSVMCELNASDFKGDLIMTRSPFIDLDQFDQWWDEKATSFNYIPTATQEIDFRYRAVMLGAGYSYNWAFAKHWLFNATLLPTISLKWSKITTCRLTDFSIDQHLYKNDWNLEFRGRAALLWNNGHYYAGAQTKFMNYYFKKPQVKMNNIYVETEAFFGLYFDIFNKKKKK